MACSKPVEPEDFHHARDRMVERQIAGRGVKDPAVLAALRNVKRHEFVPPELQAQAYGDFPLPIGNGQTISQPYIVGYMTEQLNLRRSDRVLEIGTGSGYQAAVLAEIAREVYTIELIPELAHKADELLRRLGYTNIHVRAGDGYQGWPEEAPFDAVIVTASPPEIPSALLEQLKIGGRMILPAGIEEQNLYLIIKTEKGYDQTSLLPVRFVPMIKGGSQ